MRQRGAASVIRPRYLADNDLDEHILHGVLRGEPLIEFRRVRDVGLRDADDPEILAFAAENGFIVVSHDVNTMPAHAVARVNSGASMPGLFMVRQRQPVGPVIDSLILIWSASEAGEWHGQITFLPF